MVVSISTKNVACNAGSDGSVTVNVIGVTPYSYAWSFGSTGIKLNGREGREEGEKNKSNV